IGNGKPGSLSFSLDGCRLAASNQAQGEVLVLEVKTGKVLLRANHRGADRVALSPDGRWLACNTWGFVRGAVGVWDVDAGKQVMEFERPEAPLAFSPEGKFLVVGYGNEVRYWQVGSWKFIGAVRAEREQAGNRCLAFSKTGTVLAVRPMRGHVR